MVTRCCVPNCNISGPEDLKLQFHRFPKNPTRKQKWIDAIYKGKDFKPPNTFLVCGKHFTQVDYIENLYGTQILADNAVPSIFAEELIFAQEKFDAIGNNSDIPTTSASLKDTTSNNTSQIIPMPPSSLHNFLDSSQFVKNISKDSFLEICRCCIVNKGEVNVFESQFQNVSFANLIYLCTNEKILSCDELPRSICKVCMQQIVNSFSFINKVRDMQDHIRQLQQIFSVQCEEQCDDSTLDETLTNHTITPVVKVISNYHNGSKPSNALNFKQKYKGLTKVYKQLCDILVKNKRQVKKRVKPRQKKQSVMLEKCVVEEIAEVQEMISNSFDVCVEHPRNEVELQNDKHTSKEYLSSKNSMFEQVGQDSFRIHQLNEADEVRNSTLSKKLSCSDYEEVKVSSALKKGGLLSKSYTETNDDNLVNCEIYTIPDHELNANVDNNDDHSTEEVEEKYKESDNKEEKEVSNITQCFECPEVFQTEAGIIQHCRSTGHVMTDRFKCNLCSATFRLRRLYRMHLQRHNKPKCICEICGARVYSNNLKRHMEIHTEMRNHVCQFCGITYTQKGALYDHINHKHFGVGKSLCFMCGKSFKNSSEMNKHLNSEHVDDDLASKSYQCEVCEKFFISKVSLTFHQKYSHAENPIKRPRYDKKKNDGDTVKKPFNFFKPPKPKQCTICLKYINPSGYKIHMLIHQGVKPFECKICNKRFRQDCHLKSHMNIHLNRKPFKCKYCQKCFRHSISLITHERAHTGDRPYRCSICGKGFVHSTAMKKHHQIHFKVTKGDQYRHQSTDVVILKKEFADDNEIDTDSSDSVIT